MIPLIRKWFFPLSIVFGFIATVFPASSGFWIRCEGPASGLVRDIIFRNDTVYCAGSGGLFRSTDNAESWEFMGLGDLQIGEMAQDDRYLYLAGYQGCYRYDIKTNSFKNIFNETTQTLCVVDSLILIGTDWYPGIYKSVDHGNSWQEAKQGINNYDIEKIFATQSGVILAAACGASGSGIFRSVDMGNSWVRVDPYQFAWTFHGICEFNNRLFAYNFGNYVKIYISDDDGLTWKLPYKASAPADHIYAVYSDSSGLYAGTSDHGIFKSKNNGRSWAPLSGGLVNKDVLRIVRNENYHFAATFDGVYIKRVDDVKWSHKTLGLANSTINSIASFDKILFAGVHGAGLYISEDRGKTWKHKWIKGCGGFIFDIHSTESSIFLIGSSDYLYPYGGRLFKSNDGGNTWSRKSGGLDTGLLECVAGHDDFLLLGTEFGLFRSMNQGNYWHKITNGIPYNINVADIAVRDSIAIVVNGTVGYYRTTDFGESWTYKQISGLYAAITVKIIGNDFYLGNTSFNNIYKSSDGGVTWIKMYSSDLGRSVSDFAGDGKHIYASLSEGGVVASRDSGKYWDEVNLALTVHDINCLLYDNGELYAGSNGGGVYQYISSDKKIEIISPVNNSVHNRNNITIKWRNFYFMNKYRFQFAEDSTFTKLLIDDHAVTDTSYQIRHLDFNKKYYYRVSAVTKYWNNAFSSVNSITITIPENFILDQNYPNPFNANTLIKYHIPFESRISITLYTVLGRKIRTLVDGLKKPGSYRLKLNLTGLANGVYYYQMTAPNYSKARKLVYIK